MATLNLDVQCAWCGSDLSVKVGSANVIKVYPCDSCEATTKNDAYKEGHKAGYADACEDIENGSV